MFDLDFFTKGIVIGFAIAAPVGPIGVLCIRRTLVNGVVSGLATGMGAALADALYGAVAAFGLAFVAAFLQKFSFVMQLFGGAFLMYLGLKIFLQRPKAADFVTDENRKIHNPKEIASDFISTFFLTLTNPATILSFVAIFAGFGLVEEGNVHYELSALMVLGVFLGSLAWWCILSAGIGLFRHKLDRKGLRAINMLSGMIIGGFGAAILGRLIFSKLINLFQLFQ